MSDHSANVKATTDITKDSVEAAIHKARLAQKVCERCGPRVEPDALYCSECGQKLP